MSKQETTLDTIVKTMVEHPQSLDELRKTNGTYQLLDGGVLDANYAFYLLQYMSTQVGFDLIKFVDEQRNKQ